MFSLCRHCPTGFGPDISLHFFQIYLNLDFISAYLNHCQWHWLHFEFTRSLSITSLLNLFPERRERILREWIHVREGHSGKKPGIYTNSKLQSRPSSAVKCRATSVALKCYQQPASLNAMSSESSLWNQTGLRKWFLSWEFFFIVSFAAAPPSTLKTCAGLLSLPPPPPGWWALSHILQVGDSNWLERVGWRIWLVSTKHCLIFHWRWQVKILGEDKWKGLC